MFVISEWAEWLLQRTNLIFATDRRHTEYFPDVQCAIIKWLVWYSGKKSYEMQFLCSRSHRPGDGVLVAMAMFTAGHNAIMTNDMERWQPAIVKCEIRLWLPRQCLFVYESVRKGNGRVIQLLLMVGCQLHNVSCYWCHACDYLNAADIMIYVRMDFK